MNDVNLKSLNAYGKQLTSKEIEAKVHRSFVGGNWDKIGRLQFQFIKQQGLKPRHYFLDVGCGALRGGIHFTRFLQRGHYYGIDINASLIEAGKQELLEAGLIDKNPHLLVNSLFEAYRFGVTFDYAIAQSVFTHLPMNHIIRCLIEVRKVLNPGGAFFATFFEAPSAAHTAPLKHIPGNVMTYYESDPFHYSVDEFEYMASAANLAVHAIGDWGHPKSQRMLRFSLCD